MIATYKATYNELLKRGKIGEADEPFEAFIDSKKEYPERYNKETNLGNPYSKIVCFSLYLYSMEFGDPPLYAELNRVSRDMDMNYLKQLGPYSRTMDYITWNAEHKRDPKDKIYTGQDRMMDNRALKMKLGNMAGIFLVFRGAQMKSEWIKNYEDYLYTTDFDEGENKGRPQHVNIPG